MSNQPNTSLEAIFHRRLKKLFGKREQGMVMGAFRDAVARHAEYVCLVQYSALAYGAKFKYAEADTAVWVKVGHNQVAAWDPEKAASHWATQSLCLFCDDGNFDRPVYMVLADRPENAASNWRSGSPISPWDSEWFLAELMYGGYAVLRELSEQYSYDFTTADGTYMMRDQIKRWAQLSTSNYLPPDGKENSSEQ